MTLPLAAGSGLSSPALPIVLAIVVAVGGSVVGYLGIRRNSSGRIANTDASRLWDASESMRKELSSRVVSLEAVIVRLEDKIEGLEGEVRKLRQLLEARP